MRFSYIWVFSLLLGACSEGNTRSKRLDLTVIYPVSPLGIPAAVDPLQRQWENKQLSEAARALFSKLDTADLSGSTMPTQAVVLPVFPNPLTESYFTVAAVFNPWFNGQVTLKFVITNAFQDPVQAGVIPLKAIGGPLESKGQYRVQTRLSPGNYRVYLTLSSTAHPHFYQTWGNIRVN